ncbi:MAG: hypothetical protein J5743_05645 [Victivallales bacterium]|nr:hypothetical protein [Victivallales bacterium]
MAAVTSHHHLPMWQRLLAWMDASQHGGGLFVTALETDLGDWRPPMPIAVDLPETVPWKPAIAPLLLSILFLIGAQMIPITIKTVKEEHQLDVSEKVAELEEKVEFLEESSLLPEKTAEELKESMEDLSSKNDAKDPAKTYELLDAVASRINYAADMAYETLETEASMKESFSAMLQEMLEKNAQQSKSLAELAELCDQLSLSPEDMEKLMKEMPEQPQLSPEEIQKLIEKLKEQGKTARQLQGKLCEKGLCKNKKPGEGEETEAMLVQMGMSGGNGGVNRGPGAAPLDLNGTTEDFTGTYKEEKLEALMNKNDSLLLDTQAVKPDVKLSDMEAARAGSLQGGDASVRQNRSRIHPQHRNAIKEYFK